MQMSLNFSYSGAEDDEEVQNHVRTRGEAVLNAFLFCFQLSGRPGVDHPSWDMKQDQKPNPVVQRVKVIMAAGLTLVHAHR